MKHHPTNIQLSIPSAPRSITKGSSLKELLDKPAIDCLKNNIKLVYPSFDADAFKRTVLKDIKPLGLIDRGHHIAKVLRGFLPKRYADAIGILLESLTPPLKKTDELGLGVFFYLPHISFVSKYGLDREGNAGKDPFEMSMKAQYELTRRFSAEFSMRVFLIHRQQETLECLLQWTKDKDPHVRRLCSEGSRPRLPWAMRIPAFIKDPTPALPILEVLKDDPDLYVRRSVANHLGDIAKSHPELVFEICQRWLKGATKERRWLIRHALRYPAKKGSKLALQIRKQAV